MFLKIILIFLIFLTGQVSFASITGETLLGAFGTVVIHEGGHAATSYLLGGEVLAFRPYPLKARFLKEDGTYEDKWVAGLVMSKPFQGEGASAKNAWVAAMGSGTNLLSVFLLSPLLPQLSSEFSKSSLDSMLFFSSFDMAAYTTIDLLSRDKNSDWSRVSELTGVPLVWYWLGGLAGGVVANNYRYYWHKRALPPGKVDPQFSLGFSTSY